MANKKISDLTTGSALTGSELIEIEQSGNSRKVPATYMATYIGAATAGTSNRITVTAGVIDIAATYVGQASITTVGQITNGTWSGRFSPRVSLTTSAATVSVSPASTDMHAITALAVGCTIDIKTTPTPLTSSEVVLRIKDNGTARALAFDPTTVRFLGVSAPSTTTAGRTLYMTFKYNATNNIWDCVLCTDTAGGGSSLTQYYVGVGDASNLLSGSSNLQFDGNVFTVQSGSDTGIIQLKSLAVSPSYGAIYLGNVSPSSSNFAMISTGANNYINGTQSVQINIGGLGGNYFFRVTSQDIYVQMAKIHTDTGYSLPSWGTSGVQVDFGAATYTDTSGAGTVANSVGYSFNQPTFASSSARTVTDAATLYIGNAPAAGSNTTLTNAYALWVDAGMSRFDGRINILSTTEQLRVQYDASNYYKTTVASNGLVTFDAVGSGAAFLFTDDINVGTGIYNDGGGMKHARVTTGSITGAATALITVTWTSAFPDANYTVQASVLDSTTTSLSLSVVHVESITASAVTVRVINNAATPITGTLHVTAIHD